MAVSNMRIFFVKIGHVAPKICSPTDKHANRQTFITGGGVLTYKTFYKYYLVVTDFYRASLY